MRFVSIILLMCAVAAFAQTDAEKARRIKADEEHYTWGEGIAPTREEAYKKALADLNAHISSTIHSELQMKQTLKNVDGAVDENSELVSMINTYSGGKLNNTQSLVLSEGPECRMMCYIANSEIDKIFEERQGLITDFVREGLRNQEKGNIGIALRDFYWAVALVNSLQYPRNAIYEDDGEKHRIYSWLPNRINEILDEITVEVASVDKDRADLHFRYKGEPVKYLGFHYNYGREWSYLYMVKDGQAEIDFPAGTDVHMLQVRYEYRYPEQANGYPEVKYLLDNYECRAFDKAQVPILDEKDKKSLKSVVSKTALTEMKQDVAQSAEIGVAELTDTKELQKSINSILVAIDKKSYASIRKLFTEQGWDMMDKLLNYGQARVLKEQKYGFYPVSQGRVACRSITMTFAFPNNHKKFTEDVVFTFNKDRLIDGVTFGLGMQAQTDIFERGTQWCDSSKMAIVDLLENYRTAFALKRLDYIDQLFADYAVIVTGQVVQPAPRQNMDGTTYFPKQNVIYTQYNKKEYMDRLDRIFSSNEYINIQFTDNDIKKMNGELYGIQIHQNYYSQHYGDEGYLFLLVDITDKQNPIISYRSWQPDRDPEITKHLNLPRSHHDYGLVTVGMFE